MRGIATEPPFYERTFIQLLPDGSRILPALFSFGFTFTSPALGGRNQIGIKYAFCLESRRGVLQETEVAAEVQREDYQQKSDAILDKQENRTCSDRMP